MKLMGKGRAEVYSEMLSEQAALQFPFERHFYQNSAWREAALVLDFGCGNAAYAALLNDTFVGKRFIGVEMDPEMRALAELKSAPNMTVVASLDDVPVDVKFDFVLLRLVLLHVADRSTIYRFIHKHASAKAAVLVFDAEDDQLAFDPEPHDFVRALNALRSQSQNRNLRDVIASELEPLGFRQVMSDSIVVNSTFPHARESLFKYMYRTAELGVGSPLPEPLQRELIDWWLNGPYVQYGFFGQLYQRGAIQ